jgi:hypothetical protein
MNVIQSCCKSGNFRGVVVITVSKVETILFSFCKEEEEASLELLSTEV